MGVPVADWKDQAERLGDAIQENAPDRDALDGAVLTGWVIVAEWMSPDGERWLSKMHPPNLTAWLADGMHHQALHGDWPDDEE